MKTVYVIGAGASAEVGLPTGEELKERISELFDMRFGGFGTLESGDDKILEALKLHVIKTTGNKKNLQSFVDTARHIRDGLPLAISIDNFIDTHRDNEKIALCGKLAIVCSILEAENKSDLNFDRLKANANINFNSIADTWYISFFKLLTENCKKNELCDRFKDITLIVFNYDRCIEHFLYNALQLYYGIDESEAAELVKSINIFHPYGSVGTLPWLHKDGNIEFGSSLKLKKLLELAQEIKTFTEGTDPKSSEIDEIKLYMAEAQKLVFLGFAFHKLNMQLIKPEIGRLTNCFATTYGVSIWDERIIESQIGELYSYCSSSFNVKTNNSTCGAFFKKFSKSLSF